ncbi:MAG: peroxiredoxin [Ottowia sp.]|nr:peroxiredoxin [Ottowia sp.]
MTTIKLNQAVPEFSAPATSGLTFTMTAMRGYPVVMYFYPKDNTPGCTTQANAFRDAYTTFDKLGVVLVGVSRDNIASHEKFKAKFSLPFELISDTDEHLCQLFGTIKEKKMYGKTVRGIERSTFLIDQNGVLRHTWRGLTVAGHVEEVQNTIRTLISKA